MFVRTQLAVDRLVGQLAEVGVRAGALHGGKTQSVRTRTLAEFREGRFDVLVATDVAARGIHVDGVSLVVHIDPPKDPKDYLHRAGRTARAGEAGTVVTLVLPRQRAGTFALLEKAGVNAERTQVRCDGPDLAKVTGAQEPTRRTGAGVRAGRPAASAAHRPSGPPLRPGSPGRPAHRRQALLLSHSNAFRRVTHTGWRAGRVCGDRQAADCRPAICAAAMSLVTPLP